MTVCYDLKLESIHYIDIHLGMQNNCTLQTMDKQFNVHGEMVVAMCYYLKSAIIHYVDIHLEMQYNCTLQNIMDKPVQFTERLKIYRKSVVHLYIVLICGRILTQMQYR